MDRMGSKICNVCLNKTSNTNFDVLIKVQAEILETILSGVNLSLDHQSVICCKCTDILQKCFDFKMCCLNNEESIKAFLEVNGLIQISLQDMCFKEFSTDRKVCEEQKICRLCFSWDSDYYANLEEEFKGKSLRDLLLNCLPEINLDLTYRPLVCHSCLDLLKIQYIFILDCMKLEKKIEMCHDDALDDNIPKVVALYNVPKLSEMLSTENKIEITTIKHEKPTCSLLEEVYLKNEYNIEIKQERLDMTDKMELKDECKSEIEDCCRKEKEKMFPNQCKAKEDNPLDQINCSGNSCTTKYITTNNNLTFQNTFTQNDFTSLYKCANCSYETNIKKYLSRHMIVHKDRSEIQMHKCDHCSYESKRKRYLAKHIMYKHKHHSELPLYKCAICSYETVKQAVLKRHMDRHKDPSELQMYKCKYCSYEAKQKGTLDNHIMCKHKDITNLRIYRCSYCYYKSKIKKRLKQHIILNHGNSSSVKMYKCASCPYETNLERNLIQHIKNKPINPNLQVYKCKYCSYEAKKKEQLRCHMMYNHGDPSSINMYMCAHCSYETKWKSNLAQHIKNKHEESRQRYHIRINHRHASSVNMYKCANCFYETKWKSNLTQHIKSKHKKPGQFDRRVKIKSKT